MVISGRRTELSMVARTVNNPSIIFNAHIKNDLQPTIVCLPCIYSVMTNDTGKPLSYSGSDKLYVPLSRGHQKVSSGH